MKESNDCAFKLLAPTRVNGGGRKRAPHDGFANSRGDEQRDATAKAITLLEKFVKEDDDQAGHDKLDDQEQADTRTQIRWQTVQTGENNNTSLSEREDDGKQFLGRLVELAIGLEVKVNIDEMSAGK